MTYIFDIEGVEKRYDKTDAKVYGKKAIQWSLRITGISTGSHGYDIIAGGKKVGHIMCGYDVVTKYDDEFIVEMFPTEDGREIEHTRYTRTPYKFRKEYRTLYEATCEIDNNLNPHHWKNITTYKR